jgi:hypothetical protein
MHDTFSASCLLENCGAQREMGLADLPSVFVIVYPAVDMFSFVVRQNVGKSRIRIGSIYSTYM